MKRQNKPQSLLAMITALMFNCLMGGLLASVLGFSPLAGAALFNGVALVRPMVSLFTGYQFDLSGGLLYAGLAKEIWIGQLEKNFYADGDFLNEAQDMSEHVEYNTINLAEVGADPAVLLNNASYPVTAGVRSDNPLALPLDTLDTESTIVRNLEEKETAYNKRESVIEGHRNALLEFCQDRAAFAFTPTSDSTHTPVIAATGADNGFGFKRLTISDVYTLKKRFDDNKYPKKGRNLVLTPQHVSDLLHEDKDLYKAFANQGEGKVLRLAGFNIYEYPPIAVFNKSTGVKKSWGAVAAPSTDTEASFAFLSSEVMKADGTYDMFAKIKDPDQRGDVIGFQKRFVALPKRNKGLGAIYSPAA